jgi:hypothetical protein
MTIHHSGLEKQQGSSFNDYGRACLTASASGENGQSEDSEKASDRDSFYGPDKMRPAAKGMGSQTALGRCSAACFQRVECFLQLEPDAPTSGGCVIRVRRLLLGPAITL